jgi:hypothetical protein
MKCYNCQLTEGETVHPYIYSGCRLVKKEMPKNYFPEKNTRVQMERCSIINLSPSLLHRDVSR